MRRSMIGVLRLAVSIGALLGVSLACASAQDYPVRPVTFVVPYAPGGATDIFARLLAQKLEARLGRPFVVENKPAERATATR